MIKEREAGRRADGLRTALVLAVTASPLLAEGLTRLLEGIAVIRRFPVGTGDLAGLARHARPDALVVDGSDHEAELCSVASELSIPLVRILPSPLAIQTFRDGAWHVAPGEPTSPLTIRNQFVGVLYGGPVR